uniref:CKLF like MARVEL transmembrane domain containing 7 n=1 Tax=Pseudonaja textilis TaxID=8673 RepID=A0A670Z8H5_PSETE
MYFFTSDLLFPLQVVLDLQLILLLLIGFICVRSSSWTNYNSYSYVEIVCIYDLIMIFIFYIVYIFRAYRKLTCISWPLAEFLHYLIGTILLLIASIVAVAKSSNSAGLVAGAVFGFLATFMCFLSIWLSYKVSCNTQSSGKISINQFDQPALCCPFSLHYLVHRQIHYIIFSDYNLFMFII